MKESSEFDRSSSMTKAEVDKEIERQMNLQLHPLRNKGVHEIFPVLNYFKSDPLPQFDSEEEPE